PTANTAGTERTRTRAPDGRRLMCASDGHGGAGGLDLFVARLDGASFTGPRPVPGINTRADESDAAWLGGTRAIVFARADAKGDAAVRPQLARCDGTRYADATPLALSLTPAAGPAFGPADG